MSTEFGVYLVSLERDSDRRENLKERFPISYPTMNHIVAVNGNALSAKEYFNYVYHTPQLYNRVMTPGELGCTLSHIKALETFLESGQTRALILEDDVLGDDDAIKSIHELSKVLPEDGILLCGWQEDIGLENRLFGKAYSSKQLFQLAPYSYQFAWGTFAYVVTRASATHIIAHHGKNVKLADGWEKIFAIKNRNVYYCCMLKHPSEFNASSSITADRFTVQKLRKESYWSRICNFIWKRYTKLRYKKIAIA